MPGLSPAWFRAWLPALALVAAQPAPADPLPAPIAAALEAYGLPADSLSVLVEDARGGAPPMLAWNADVARNPASVMKLLTTLAALEILGPAFSWRTSVHVETEPVDGRVPGPLWLRGGGDPFLVSERLWGLLRGARERGLRAADGGVAIDDRYFEAADHDPGAFDRKRHRAYNVGAGAALVNFGASVFTIEPSREPGRTRIIVDPPVAGLRVENQVQLVSGACRGRLKLHMDVLSESEPAVRFRGDFPDACPSYSLVRAVAAPDAFARGVIEAIWGGLGGEIGPGLVRGALPEGATIVHSVDSPPLSDLVRGMNKHSNNVMIRNLLLTIGAEKGGAPGTLEKGRAAISGWLAESGLDFPELRLDNGAGLSRDARISARSLGRLLRHAHRSPLRAEFVSSLPIAGVDGSLRRRFEGEALAGRAHLKTGLVDDVRAIAGYVHAGERDVVVVVMQSYPDVHEGSGTRVQDAVLRWVVALLSG